MHDSAVVVGKRVLLEEDVIADPVDLRRRKPGRAVPPRNIAEMRRYDIRVRTLADVVVGVVGPLILAFVVGRVPRPAVGAAVSGTPGS
jgi:hypothetical protein